MERTLVVLPTYNERENLSLMVASLLALPLSDLQILVVDDNSPDGTGELADQLAAANPDRVYVLHRPAKEGLGRAYVAGFRHALSMGADYIVQMDADFSHNPNDILRLVDAMRTNDMVIGSRYIKGASVDESWSFSRKLLSWFANRVYLPIVMDISIVDATGGFRIWRRETLVGLDLQRIQSNGYVFQVEMCYVAYRLGFRISEIPIHFAERKRGSSKMDRRIQIEAAVHAFKFRHNYHYLNANMRVSKTNEPLLGDSAADVAHHHLPPA